MAKKKSSKTVSCLRHFKALAAITGPVNIALILPLALVYAKLSETENESSSALIVPCFYLPIFEESFDVSAALQDPTQAAAASCGAVCMLLWLFAISIQHSTITLFHNAGGTIAADE